MGWGRLARERWTDSYDSGFGGGGFHFSFFYRFVSRPGLLCGQGRPFYSVPIYIRRAGSGIFRTKCRFNFGIALSGLVIGMKNGAEIRENGG